MNLTEAHRLIASEMRTHGLIQQGWTWKFDNAKNRMGLCNHTYRRLQFSRELFRVNTPERCMDTIRHEIAHAIAGSGAGHGPTWKRIVSEIGGTPRRCFSAEDTVMAQAKYVGHCGENCEHTGKHGRHRMTDNMRFNRLVCKFCRTVVRWKQTY